LLTATAIVLGSNVGTCFTALIAVIHSTKAARKVALAHLILNIGGLIIFLPFISIYCSFIELTADSLTRQIANTHTIYNLICSLIVLPFSTAFANFVSWTYSLLNNRNC
jgi:phosphate:Na+ symporter